MISFHAPLNALYGVGEKRAALLKKLGMETVGDLLYHFPRGYQNRGDVMRLADAPDGVTGAFVLTISSRPTTARLPGRMTLTKVRAFDESGVCTLTFFNQPYLSDSLAVGASFRFWGRIAVKNGQIMLSPTDREQIVAGKPLPDFTAVYPLTAGLTQRSLACARQGKPLPAYTVPGRPSRPGGRGAILCLKSCISSPWAWERQSIPCVSTMPLPCWSARDRWRIFSLPCLFPLPERSREASPRSVPI